MDMKRTDWVTCAGFAMVGVGQRVARDGSWVDVKWPTGTKRMRPTKLTVQHTIKIGDYEVTDLTRQKEMDEKSSGA